MSLVRYADDFIIGFEYEEDALKVNRILPKRMEKYGQSIHPEKSKLLRFTPDWNGKPPATTNYRTSLRHPKATKRLYPYPCAKERKCT
jgi:hypothetical protein